MYSANLNVLDTCKILGVGRNRVLQLCKNRTHGFPAVMVGNRYQIDEGKLLQWRDDWYNGKFVI